MATLAFFNIAGWNGFVLFGVQQLPAGRSAIIAYTMPIWATLIAMAVLHEPLNRRKIVGLVLGMLGMAILLGDDIRHIRSTPTGALLILAAAILWACGTVLLRKWKPPIAQNALSGWMMLLGWLPLAIAGAVLRSAPGVVPDRTCRAGRGSRSLYNIFLAGTLAHWAWFTLARTLPVAVSSLSSLPVPVVGVFAGMLFLGERPGAAEFIALALVLASLFAVLFQPKAARPGRRRRRRSRRPELCRQASSGISVSTVAGEPRVEVRLAQVAHRLARLVRRAADVRQQHDVVHREQRRRDVRLVGEDVEAGALDRSRLRARRPARARR